MTTCRWSEQSCGWKLEARCSGEGRKISRALCHGKMGVTRQRLSGRLGPRTPGRALCCVHMHMASSFRVFFVVTRRIRCDTFTPDLRKMKGPTLDNFPRMLLSIGPGSATLKATAKVRIMNKKTTVHSSSWHQNKSTFMVPHAFEVGDHTRSFAVFSSVELGLG